MSETDKETLRKAAAKFGVELEPHEKRTDPSPAQAFARQLEKAGPVSRLALESKPEGLAIPFANASPPWAPNAGWDNSAPKVEPLPPPSPPKPALALPYVNAPPAWLATNGGYDNSPPPAASPLPPPKMPPPGTYVMGPNGPEPVQVAMGQPHCECKEPKS